MTGIAEAPAVAEAPAAPVAEAPPTREEMIEAVAEEGRRYAAALKVLRRGAIAARRPEWCRSGLDDWLRRHGLLSMRHSEDELDARATGEFDVEEYTAKGLVRKLAKLRARHEETLASIRSSAIRHARTGDVALDHVNAVLAEAGLAPHVERIRTGFSLEGRFYSPLASTPERHAMEEAIKAAFERALAEVAPEGAETRFSVRCSRRHLED